MTAFMELILAIPASGAVYIVRTHLQTHLLTETPRRFPLWVDTRLSNSLPIAHIVNHVSPHYYHLTTCPQERSAIGTSTTMHSLAKSMYDKKPTSLLLILPQTTKASQEHPRTL